MPGVERRRPRVKERSRGRIAAAVRSAGGDRPRSSAAGVALSLAARAASPTAAASSDARNKLTRSGSRETPAGGSSEDGPRIDQGGRPPITELRREASTILRALNAARAAPGGLRATLGGDPELIGRLLDALCVAGMLYQACALFREALDAGVRPPAAAMERLVRHGVRAGRPAEVAAAFVAFKRAGGKPTLRTYTDLVAGLSKKAAATAAARSRKGKSLGVREEPPGGAGAGAGSSSPTAIDVWLMLRAAGEDDVSLALDGAAYTAAVGAYMTAGQPHEAERLVREMGRAGVDPGPRLYNVLIAAHGRAGDLQGIEEAERRMRAANVRPNAATHGARVAAYVRCDELARAERALNSGRSDKPGATPGVHAYTALVQGLVRAGQIEEARGWLRTMREDGVAPNAHTYSVIVDGLVRRGELAKAEAMLEAMRAEGVEPTAVTYNTLLKSCVAGTGPAESAPALPRREGAHSGTRANEPEPGGDAAAPSEGEPDAGLARARRVLEAMQAAGVGPTVVTYNTLIDACVSAGEPTEAMFGVLSALVAQGHRPDVVTYTTLLKHFSREGDVVAARWLMREMEADAGVVRDAQAYNCLTDALTKQGLMREAVGVLTRMTAAGLTPDSATFGALMDGYARVGDAAAAEGLYRALCGRGEGESGREWRIAAGGIDASDADAAVVASFVVDADVAVDARMRGALITACARCGGARAAAVVEGVIDDVIGGGWEGCSAEAAELRARWRREGTVKGGTTVLRKKGEGHAGKSAKAKGGGTDDAVPLALDPRAGCPIPASWGPQPEQLWRQQAPVAGARKEPDEWSRGLEMWKHWLGLPSQYYGDATPTPPSRFKSSGKVAANEVAADDAAAAESTGGKKVYSKEEIAEAVQILRAAAARRYPNDPETALRLALEVAEEGDAGRMLLDDEREGNRA